MTNQIIKHLVANLKLYSVIQHQRWFRRLSYFYKIKKYGLQVYLIKLIPLDTHSFNTRFFENITTYRSSRPEVFLRKGFLKISGKFTGAHPCQSVIPKKLELQETTLPKCDFSKVAMQYRYKNTIQYRHVTKITHMTSDLIYIISCTFFEKNPRLLLKKIENLLTSYQNSQECEELKKI